MEGGETHDTLHHALHAIWLAFIYSLGDSLGGEGMLLGKEYS